MKRKKFWIILISAILGLGVVVFGLYFSTKLSTVNVEFRSRLDQSETRLASGVLDVVKDSAEFDYKDSVLFINTQKHIDKIEKSNPYVKVQQVIRKFPNKIYVYISERVPKYRIQDETDADIWYILDEDFKVVEKLGAETLQSQKLDEKTVEIEYLTQNVSVGEFLASEAERTKLNTILSGVYGRTKDYFVVRSINFLSATNMFELTMRETIEREDGSISYGGGCIIQLENSGDVRVKALNGTSVYAGDGNKVSDQNFQKVIILAGEQDCIVRNQE